MSSNPCLKKCDMQKFSYKTTCDLLWDTNCSNTNSPEKNKILKQKFSECAAKRKAWKLNCIKPSCFDEGHEYAIQKMVDKANNC